LTNNKKYCILYTIQLKKINEGEVGQRRLDTI